MDKILEQIKKELKQAYEDHEKITLRLSEINKRISRLTKARMCDNHDWHETGGFMYATWLCSKCHYRFTDD